MAPEMSEISKLPNNANPGGADEPQWCELAEFLGRMLAFLEGPAESTPHGDVLADDQAKIVARLAGARLAAYNRGYSIPGDGIAQRSALLALLDAPQKHYAVELDRDTRDRWLTWLDTYAQRLGHFSAEQEKDLVKLRGWLEKVRARDVLGAGLSEDAARALERCQQALEGFAERVYAEADAAS